MDAALNRKSLVFGIPGIILQLVGNFGPALMSASRPSPPMGLALGGLAVVLVGTGLLMTGLWWYAKAKGHSGWWCLMGLLSILGLIVLGCLPDRNKA